MTPEAQNLAIAEACGWKYLPTHEDYPWDTPDGDEEVSCPSYTIDLNAMHEAEKVLKGGQRADYIDNLSLLVAPYMATAAQRARAFLRTLNLWEDENN